MKHYYDIAIGPNGKTLANVFVTIYVAGTGQSTQATIYSNDGITIKTQPFQTDALGNFDFYVADGRYDIKLSAPFVTTRLETDIEISDVTEDNTGDATWNVGAINIQSQGGDAVVFADQYASVSAAIAALPAAGGCVDARSPNVNLALGTIDPGTKSVTLLLGPLSYTADHIVLQSNFRVIGSAPVNTSGTVITSVGSNSQALIVNATSGLLNVRFPVIENVTFIGLSGNTTQNGFLADLAGNTAGSVIDHLEMKAVNFSGFKGKSIYIKGPANNGSFNQFWKFDHVVAVRPSSAAEALRITGASGQMDFYSCQFDGAAKGDGTNIFIGTEANGDTALPYSINFYSLTCQGSSIGFQGSGFNQVGFYGSHHENINIVYQLDALHTNSRNSNITFDSAYMANCANNSGSGRTLKVTTSLVWGARLINSNLQTVPDRLVESTSGAEVVTINNTQAQSLSTAFSTTGVDASLAPAATMNVGTYRTIVLSTSATLMTTLNSQLGPGEQITFFANGTCQFATGGNIVLGNLTSPLTLLSGDTATFENSDFSGTNAWRLIGTTVQAGSGLTKINTTGLAANVGSTLLYAVPAGAGGMYRVSGYAVVTQQATTSSTLPNIQLVWTDNDTNVASAAINVTGNSGGSPVNPAVGFNSNNLAAIAAGNADAPTISVKAGTNINYSTVSYASVGATPMQYAIHIRLEFIG